MARGLRGAEHCHLPPTHPPRDGDGPTRCHDDRPTRPGFHQSKCGQILPRTLSGCGSGTAGPSPGGRSVNTASLAPGG